MHLTTLAGTAAGILSLVMFLPYVRDILAHRSRPQRASWLIWSVLGGIAVASQFAEGARLSLWMTIGATIGTVLTFLLSIHYGVGGLSRRDLLALAAAGFGLLLWYLTRHAAVALFITIAIDAIGAVLTAEKSYLDPSSETLSLWVMSAAAGILGAMAVGSLNWILLAYPIYVFLANSTVITAILLGRRRP
jgi:hypothetical protein